MGARVGKAEVSDAAGVASDSPSGVAGTNAEGMGAEADGVTGRLRPGGGAKTNCRVVAGAWGLFSEGEGLGVVISYAFRRA